MVEVEERIQKRWGRKAVGIGSERGKSKNSSLTEEDMHVTAKQISMCGNRW